MTVRLEDPEARLQHARDVAWKALNRRERTVAELGRLLAAKRVEPSAIETVLAELSEQGYLDDASYAQRFADDRRRLDAWGAERIERKLLSLGIDREVVAAAVGEQDHAGEMEAALELLARRFPEPPQTPRERDRALGVLVRKGYDLELAYDALRRHAGVRRRAAGLTARDALRGPLASVCARASAVLRSAQATDRVEHGPKRPANHYFLQSGIQQLRRDGDQRHLFRARTLESQAGGPGHTDPTAHLAAI